jgi:tetratricopeptide (TPR) repeat protein
MTSSRSADTADTQKWVLKDVEGRIYGPFTTAQILSQIDRGFIQGGELVALYPGGTWLAVSKTPEFYDRLLDVLSAEIKPVEPSIVQARPNIDPTQDEVTDVSATDPTGGVVASSASMTSLAPSHTSAALSPSAAPPAGLPQPPHANRLAPLAPPGFSIGTSKIDISELRTLDGANATRSGQGAQKAAVILIAVALVLGAAGYWLQTRDSHKNVGARLRLLAPKKNQPVLTDAKIVEKFKRAIGAFQNDTFTGYLRAENELVEIVEGAPLTAEAAPKKAEWLSMLCLTYRELWPFSYQDSVDLRTLSLVMQEAKRVDPGGYNGTTCEIVQLMLSGRYLDAQGLSESILSEAAQSPMLYELRGDIFMARTDFQSALSYFAQASSLWAVWQKPVVQQARAQAKLKKFSNAVQLYQQVLQKVPTHAIAKIEMALIESVQFGHVDKAFDLFQLALRGDEKVPRTTESQAYFGLAQIYERRSQIKKAIESAQRSYAIDPSNLEAKAMVVRLAGEKQLKNDKGGGQELVSVGDQYVRAGDCFAAQAQFKAAFDLQPTNGVAAMKAGKCLWELNQALEAIEWLKKAVAADPQLTSAYALLADYLAQRFDYTAASQIMSKIQAKQPNNYEVYRGFATVELRRNNFQGAIGFSQRALKLYENDEDTILIMAKALLGLQNYAEARRFALRALELDSTSSEAHALSAKALAGQQGVDAGAQELQQLINRFVITQGQQVPAAAIEYRIALGELYMKDERYTQAEEALRQAIALDRNSKKAHLVLGKVLQGENRLPEALETYLKSAILDPSDADPIFLSGILYEQAGKLPEALRQFERVLKINSLYPRAHIQLGRVYLRQGDSKRALDEANQERLSNPNLPDSYTLAAEAYYGLKQYSNCASEYQQAVRRSRSVEVMTRMARCYRLSGSLDSAESLLRQATSIESGNADLFKEQGAIFQTKGLADEAISAYDTYLKLAPNAPDRDEVKRRMQRIQLGDLQLTE